MRRFWGCVVAFVALVAGAGGLVATFGQGWLNLASRDKHGFLVCSAYQHDLHRTRQLYVGLLKISAVGFDDNQFDDTDRPGGSWCFAWEMHKDTWASRNLGPEVDFYCLAGRDPLQVPIFEHKLAYTLGGKFAGVFLRCGTVFFSYSVAGDPGYRTDLHLMEYRLNGATSIQLSVPAWLLFIICELGFLPMELRQIGRIRAYRRRVQGKCLKCGYDLRSTPTRCPECGQKN